MSDLPDPIETEKAVDEMERFYPSAIATYREAVQSGVINFGTFCELCIDFMKAPAFAREDSEAVIRKGRQSRGMVAPDESVAHNAEGTCHRECAKEPDTYKGPGIVFGLDRTQKPGGLGHAYERELRARFPDGTKRPEGVSSGIALQASYEAEMDRIQKDIAAQYIKLAYEPQAEDPRDVLVKCSRCRYVSRKASEATQCPQCRYIHGKGRLPAMPDVTQYKAADATTYRRLQDPARDLVVILAQGPTGMRYVQIDGKLWHLLSGRTNAPEGEIAITDDDLETLLQHEPSMKTLIFGSKARSLGKHQDELTRQLFMTDPEIREYVGKQMDVGETFVVDSYWHKRFYAGMEKAFTMGWTRNPKYPQECAWVEACHSRACAMMGHDPDLK